MGHQTLHIFGVELARYEDEPAFHADHPRLWRNELRHILHGRRRLKQVTHFDPFGLEILCVMRVRGATDRYLLVHLNAVTLESDHLLWIIRYEAKLAHPEIVENLRADAIIAQVAGEAEFGVRFDRIETFLLQLVSMNLSRQP